MYIFFIYVCKLAPDVWRAVLSCHLAVLPSRIEHIKKIETEASTLLSCGLTVEVFFRCATRLLDPAGIGAPPASWTQPASRWCRAWPLALAAPQT